MKINRIVYMVVRRFYYVPRMLVEIKTAGNREKYTVQERYNKIRTVVKNINKYGHMKIRCEGQENIPDKNGYILFPNHQGLYDVLLIIDTHEKPLSVVMRNDLEKIKFLSWVKDALDGKMIDRDDVRQGLKIINEMKDEVINGKNFVIFPEGTRSKEKNNVGTFKGGTFKSAVKAKAPIVPVALIDSFKPFDEKGTTEVQVQIHYLKPIMYDEYKEMKTTEIAEKVRRRITKKIEEEENYSEI